MVNKYTWTRISCFLCSKVCSTWFLGKIKNLIYIDIQIKCIYLDVNNKHTIKQIY